ncbi:hypothetical protein [Methyloglobulus sp.]|uniref:hypothetical protein n=1 Tax=Methyloglobulus sp. TaxID=2518622 RepID=UPI0032B7A999
MTHTKLTLCSLVALLATGQAFAHTGVRDAADEGKSSYNGFTITHGCGGDSGQAYPVIGQSALFPFGDKVVWKDAAGAVIEVGGNGLGTISAAKLSLGVTGYTGASSGFATSQEIVDDLGNVQALLWKDGAMEPKLNSITPFKVTAPTIANNCVKSLKIRMGVINYCDKGKNAANDAMGPYKAPEDAFERKIPLLSIVDYGGIQTNVNDSPVYKNIAAGNDDNNRADWWFMEPYGTSALYNDPEVLQPSYWTTFTVNNSAADIAACAGTPVDVTVEPTGEAFDAYLTGRNTRPFTKGDVDL